MLAPSMIPQRVDLVCEREAAAIIGDDPFEHGDAGIERGHFAGERGPLAG